MKSNNYTLNRFEGEYAIFLKRPKEVEQLLIARSELQPDITVGSVVTIEDDGLRYNIQKLDAVAISSEEGNTSLINKLQEKNN